ncbi:molecular chaperone [Shewanella intestini]|uniref:Molecular chaperone TorD n=1 Tax=Shewanella intestini TaxID=2017544 RepID=A0ABS5I6G0_9GAMM|nr:MULTISPECIES: molecular chaperone TorD family protein [Shewanella]MBR9729616.1 molecular chaperone TorD [Shewanella intestini]MRG37686.1 molecular chaperone TorD [Shewanella sp. XMDDZSB0408]
MTATSNLQELQAIARVLHNLLLDYPSESSLQQLVDDQIAQQWPVLTDSPLNKQGKAALALFATKWDSSQINQMKLDYGQLFFGPGEPKAMLWGSVYMGEQQIINDTSTVELMRFYQQFGISFELKYKQPVDHLALFYAVIDQLLEQMMADPKNNVAKEALIILLQQHMLPWAGRCLDLAIEHAETDLYKGVALLAKDFQSSLATTLNVVPMPMRLFR